jgi:hypothetical protein
METHYHCTAEWHLSKLKGSGATLAPLIYNFAFYLSKKSGVFYASIPRLAAYFSADEKTVRKAIRLLVKQGFFELLGQSPGATVRYKPISHTIWKTKYLGCSEKLTAPWANEPGQDKLAVQLHAISGGQYTAFSNLIKGMRNTRHSEAAILEHFRTFIDIERPVGKRWGNGFSGHFIQYLRQQPVVVQKC